jgi:hypothetical protein
MVADTDGPGVHVGASRSWGDSVDTKAELDIRQGEQVESETDVFIARRHAKRVKEEGERPKEVAWAESVRRYERHEEKVRLWERKRYHEAMIRAHEANFAAVLSGHRRELVHVNARLGISDEETMKGEAA